MMRSNVTKFGFTLIEVLVALVILSLAFTASFLSFSMNAQSYERIQDKTSAQWVGMNVIALIQTGALKFPSLSGELTGSQEMFEQSYDWRAYQQATDNNTVMQLTVDINKNNTLISSVSGYTTVTNQP